jgi:calmodulin
MMTVETKPANFEQEMLAAFKVFDKDGSGTIDGDEIAKVMESFGEKLSDEELKIMMEEVDKDGNGTIDCTYPSFDNFERARRLT